MFGLRIGMLDWSTYGFRLLKDICIDVGKVCVGEEVGIRVGRNLLLQTPDDSG